MTQTNVKELSSNDLRRTCDSNSLNFDTTNDLPDLQDGSGQKRY